MIRYDNRDIGLSHKFDGVKAPGILPLMLLGTWAGGRAFARTSESGFRRMAMLVLLATAIASGLRGLAGLV